MCLALGVALPVVPVLLVTRRARRQLTTASAYREVARALDLDVDTRGMSLHGVRDDRPLWVGEVLVGEGAERRREVHGVIGFRHPLGLGVNLRPKHGRRDSGEPLGHPLLDKKLVASASHPAALPVVRKEHVISALAALATGAKELRMGDERVRVRLSRSPSTAAELGLLVERLENTATALETAARAAERPPVVVAWLADLRRLAEELGLRVDEPRVRLHGPLSGWPVEIVPHHVHGRWTTWLAVRFAPEVDTGMRVHPQRTDDPDGQDIILGDPSFDPAFEVKGYDPEAVRTRLGPEVRSALVALNGLGAVSLDDHALVVRELPPGCLSEAIGHARTVARHWAAGHAEIRVIDV